MPPPREKGILTEEGTEGKPAPEGHNYLLAIAIDAYEDCPRLYNCVRDAERLIEILTSQFQFEPARVRTLFDREATESGIFDAFRYYLDIITPADNLVIFFSGHGEYEKAIGEGYWLPVDARQGRYEDYITNSRITKYIRSIPSRHTLVIVDSCFSGTLFASKRLEAPDERLYQIPSRWLLTAGREEIVSDGAPGDHSPFADNLLYFLESFTGDGLAIGELSRQVITAVAANARQTPRGEPLQDVGHRGGQFVFFRKGVTADTPLVPAARQPGPPPAPKRNWLPYIAAAIGLLVVLILIISLRPHPPASRATTPEITRKENHQPSSTPPQNPEQSGEEQLRTILKEAAAAEKGREWQKAASAIKRAIEIRPDDAALQERLNTYRAELAWEKALADNSRIAYNRYLEAFPQGGHRTEAREKIATIERSPPPEFTFSLRQDGKLLVDISRGKPPFLLAISRAEDKKELLRRNIPASGRTNIDLGPYQASESQILVIRLKDAYQKVRPASAILPGKGN